MRRWLTGFLLIFLTSSLFADKILVLHSFDESLDWAREFDEALFNSPASLEGQVEFYIEFLDSVRFPKNSENFLAYLKTKYRDIAFDAIFADSDQACEFIETYYRPAPEMIRIYYSSRSSFQAPRILNLQTQSEKSINHTWGLIEGLSPNPSQVVIVAGEERMTQALKDYFNERLSGQGSEFSLRVIENYSFVELKSELAALEGQAVVLFVPVLRDRLGVQFKPQQLLSELSAISPAPIYSFWEPFIGTGILGGHLMSVQKLVSTMLEAYQEFRLEGAFAKDYSFSDCILDGEVLARFGLEKQALPCDAKIVNQPASWYQRHARLIADLSLASLLGVLFFLLVGVFLLRRTNRRLRASYRKLNEAQKMAESLALKDSLTGLANRRSLEINIKHEIDRRQRIDTPLSLLIVDLDHFKNVNDRYGHDVGDQVLKGIANTLIDFSRSTDLAARWGGEEFVLLLPDTDESYALIIAERVRRTCEKLEFAAGFKITVSIGLAQYQRDEQCNDWFRRADQALYVAKESGRNRTIAASGIDLNRGVLSRHEILLLTLNWREEYSVGHEEIDRQHRELFEEINRCIFAVINKRGKQELKRKFKALIKRVQTHFDYEEEVLAKRNKRDLNEHIKEHFYLVENAKLQYNLYLEGILDAHKFLEFFSKTLVGKHTMIDDLIAFGGAKRVRKSHC